MAKYSLAAYTIRVGKDNKYWKLGNIDGKDLFNELKQYFESLQNTKIDENFKKVLKIKELDLDNKNRELKGIIETGEYGYEAPLFDIVKNEPSYTKKKTEAELLPFYFRIYIPSDKNEGIILLQKIKQMGIRTILSQELNKYFEQSNFIVELNHYLDKEYVENYLQHGRLSKIRYIKYNYSEDRADNYRKGDHEEDMIHVELSIIPKKGKELEKEKRKISECFRLKKSMLDLGDSGIEILNFKPDRIKIEVEMNGQKKVITLYDNFMSMRAYYDITESVTYDETGHPTYRSLNSIADVFLNRLKKQLHRE